MTIHFPRPRDELGHAWGLDTAVPIMPWERFSAPYEARLEALVRALEAMGYSVRLGGAGGQDGEFIVAEHPNRPFIFKHLEDPSEGAAIDELLRQLCAERDS